MSTLVDGIKSSGGSYRSGANDGDKRRKLLLMGVAGLCLVAALAMLYVNVFAAKRPGDGVESAVQVKPAERTVNSPPSLTSPGALGGTIGGPK